MQDGLYMADGGTGGTQTGTAAAAWRNLALLADCAEGEATGGRVASGLSVGGTATQSSLAVRNLLHEILVDTRSDPDAESVMANLSELFLALDPKILTSVLRAESDGQRRVDFVVAASERLPVRALIRFSAGAAAASERAYPPPVRALIQKLARRALTLPSPSDREAEDLLRRQLVGLFRSWLVRRDQNAARTRRRGAGVTRRPAGRAAPEAERILEMAIECDGTGDAVWSALHEVIEDGGLGSVIDRVKRAPPESATAAAIMKRVGTPQELRRLLQTEPLDGAAVDTILRGLGLSAAKVMLEELVESRQRLTRRYLMDRLARFGPEIRPLVEGRLRDQRWFVQRNMIALLRSAKCPADPATVERFMANKDARVRRETALWALDNPVTRDEGLARAVGDPDPAILRPALQAARAGLPSMAVPVLARRLIDADFPPEFRVLSINLLGRSGSLLALEALLHFAQNGTTLFGKPRLAAKSPEMLAALAAIAKSWPAERRASALLAQARRTRDADIANALQPSAPEAAA